MLESELSGRDTMRGEIRRVHKAREHDLSLIVKKCILYDSECYGGHCWVLS